MDLALVVRGYIFCQRPNLFFQHHESLIKAGIQTPHDSHNIFGRGCHKSPRILRSSRILNQCTHPNNTFYDKDMHSITTNIIRSVERKVVSVPSQNWQ